jgi:hypothetical protein
VIDGVIIPLGEMGDIEMRLFYFLNPSSLSWKQVWGGGGC